MGTLDAAMATSAGDFIFRAAVSDELEIFGPSDWVGDLAFLYGRPFRIGGSWATASRRCVLPSPPVGSAGWSSGSR